MSALTCSTLVIEDLTPPRGGTLELVREVPKPHVQLWRMDERTLVWLFRQLDRTVMALNRKRPEWDEDFEPALQALGITRKSMIEHISRLPRAPLVV